MNSIILAKLLIILYPDEYLFDSNLRVTNVAVVPDHDYGYVLEITVKEIDNESK